MAAKISSKPKPNEIVYSPSEARLFDILKESCSDEKSAKSAEDIAKLMYKRGAAPYHATRVAIMTLKSLGEKIRLNAEPFSLKKSKRRGPYPISYWLEKR